MTLEEVREAFELWRASRLKRGPIPESLWLMVQELRPHYKKSRITKALRINGAQLELGCQKHSADKKTSDGFAIGHFSHPSSNMMQQTYQRCELTLTGLHRSLQMNIELSQLAHVLPLVERYL